ncbi:MAG: ParB/RepB/Spo0J family partition protein [Nitrospira sp.]|nr:ParB/RepB/Spo0J family partition protein [Nitrospira sp.]
MSKTLYLKLSSLAVDDANVRKTGVTEGLEELKASIATHGLLQPLIVRKQGKKYAVTAGQRRFFALQALQKDGIHAKDDEVHCVEVEAGADATEISLAENTVRLQMHPADQFDAFNQLQQTGSTPAEIAVRFGCAESTVLKLLKLARVSPKILSAYRAGELNLEQVQAFASSDDQQQQESVFSEINPEYTDPDQIRDALTPEGDIPHTDKRALYVGIDTYIKADGKIRGDLFTESKFLLDPALLHELAVKKLAKSEKKICGEGWSWVEIDPDLDWDKRNRHGHIHEDLILAPEQRTQYEELQVQADLIENEWYESGGDSDKPKRLVELEDEIETIEDGARGYDPQEMTLAGAFITIDRNGKAEIMRGYVKPEHKAQLAAMQSARAKGDETAIAEALETMPEPKLQGMSASLTETLTDHRSAALKATLALNPQIGLAAAVHAIADGIFYKTDRSGSCLNSFASRQYHRLAKDTIANDELDREETQWRDRIPGNEAHFWLWCLEQDRDTLIALLTFCTALSIDATQRKSDKPDCPRLQHAGMLVKALKLDMSLYFRPDAENYFGKISKDMILADITEITGNPPSPAQLRMKKGELASVAARLVEGTGWLPVVLRAPHDALETVQPTSSRKKRAV